MADKIQNTKCAEFQAELPHMMEVGARFDDQPHLAECQTCADLVADLRYIAEQAKLLLPLHDPSPKVWTNIKASLTREGWTEEGGAKEAKKKGAVARR